MGREFPTQPVVGVGAIVLRRAGGLVEVLLVRRANPPSQGEWSLPGGVVELGERLQDAIVREVREETGLDVDPIAVVEVLDHIVVDEDAAPVGNENQVRFHYVLIDFACRVTGGELAPATDASDVFWCPADGLSKTGQFALASRTLAVIEKAIAATSLGAER